MLSCVLLVLIQVQIHHMTFSDIIPLLFFLQKLTERHARIDLMLFALFQGCGWEVFTREMPSSIQRKNWKVKKQENRLLYPFYIWIESAGDVENVSQQHEFHACLLCNLQELPCFLLSFDWSLRRGERWVQAPAAWRLPLPQTSNSQSSHHKESVFINKAVSGLISVNDVLGCLRVNSEIKWRANRGLFLSWSDFCPENVHSSKTKFSGLSCPC